MKKSKLPYWLFERLFRNVRPFDWSYSSWKSRLGYIIIGVRFNKFWEIGFFRPINSLDLFYGKNYKAFKWIDK